jgi:hypothetical protein
MLILAASVLLALCAADVVVQPAALAPAPYADWAHKHWCVSAPKWCRTLFDVPSATSWLGSLCRVWLSNDQSTQQNVSDYVTSYLSRNIVRNGCRSLALRTRACACDCELCAWQTVGGLDIDSGWSTGYNNFIVDTNKFPNMTQLVTSMHGLGVVSVCGVSEDSALCVTHSSRFTLAADVSASSCGPRAWWIPTAPISKPQWYVAVACCLATTVELTLRAWCRSEQQLPCAERLERVQHVEVVAWQRWSP